MKEFTIIVVLLFILVINNLVQVVAILPQYESNLEQLISDNASLLGIENEPTWENLRRATLDATSQSRRGRIWTGRLQATNAPLTRGENDRCLRMRWTSWDCR